MYLKTAEELLTPYSWGRYDLLCLPGSFPYGGMEVSRGAKHGERSVSARDLRGWRIWTLLRECVREC